MKSSAWAVLSISVATRWKLWRVSGKLEEDLKVAERRIAEIKIERDEANERVERTREQIDDTNALIERWCEAELVPLLHQRDIIPFGRLVEDIVQTLVEYRRSGTMPDDAMVFGWRHGKRPANAVDVKNDEIMKAWAYRSLIIALRVADGPRDYMVVDSDLMRQLEGRTTEEAEANGKRRRDGREKLREKLSGHHRLHRRGDRRAPTIMAPNSGRGTDWAIRAPSRSSTDTGWRWCSCQSESRRWDRQSRSVDGGDHLP
jgi:hypothetical protein